MYHANIYMHFRLVTGLLVKFERGQKEIVISQETVLGIPLDLSG